MKAKRFSGFPRHMPTFFRGLEKNNDRAWFAPRKEHFETHVRAPMVELVTRLNDHLRAFAVDHVVEEPARAIYRIYRDTRFSKDKTPYKTHLGATFPHRFLPRHAGAGYYFEVSHRYLGIAGGVYMPGPEELLVLRRAIAANPRQFLALVEARPIRTLLGTLQGERLVRLPKPIADHASAPIADYLRMKQFYWWVELPAAEALSRSLETTLLRHFRAMQASLDWFNRALLAEQQQRQESSRPTRPTPMW